MYSLDETQSQVFYQSKENIVMKKFLSVFLAIAVLVLALPLGTLSLKTYAIQDDYTYVVQNGEVTLTGVNKSISGEIILPSEFDGFPVTKIKANAFFGCVNLTGVTIPDTITIIEGNAFQGCTSLKNINLHDNLKKIGWQAFNDTAYYADESIWKDGVLYIGSCLIDTKNTIPNTYHIKAGTTIIADMAFNYRINLTNVTIPDGVTSIGRLAFFGCQELKSITIPNSVKSIDYGAFSGCYRAQNLIIGNGVISIGEEAFSDCNSLTQVTIPASVTYIGDRAFRCNSFTEINVDINNNNYSSLDGVLFDKNKTTLIQYPAKKSSTSYTIPSSVTQIGVEAFPQCKNLTSIVIPESVTSVGDSAIHSTQKSFTIYGFEGSYAQAYAEYLKLKFVKLEYTDSWDNLIVDTTGVYAVVLGLAQDTENFLPTSDNEELFLILDKNQNAIKYNSIKGGYPLIAGEEYKIIPNNDFEFIGYALANTSSMLFPDAGAGDWYSDSVAYVVGTGIMSGYSNGKFGTTDSIQRQDFIVMLARFAGADLDEYKDVVCIFKDVKDGSYYEAAINWALAESITTGYDNGEFGVGDKMTREQIVTLLYRYAKDYLGMNVSVGDGAEAAIASQYTDYSKASSFSRVAIVWAIENGVISGKNTTTIAPQGNAQRCEVAKIMYNIYLSEIF